MLERCVAVEPSVFGRDFWGRGPLLSRAQELPGPFTDLLSADAVDELIAERGVRTPFLRMARDGTVLDRACFTRSGGFGAEMPDQIDSAGVLAEYAQGASIVLQGLHRLWPPLVHFARGIVDDIGYPTQVNAYITPPGSRGFDPHHDVHDVFVLQVDGHKHWRVHAPVFAHPLSFQPWTDHREAVAARARDEPVLDVELGPGDALYLPRGWIHSAVALGETSIHLTVGVEAFTGYDLARDALAALARDEDLRRPLPFGLDLTDRSAVEPEVRKALAAVVEVLTRHADEAAGQTAGAVRDRFLQRTRPTPVRPLETLSALGGFDATSTVALRHALVVSLEEERTGGDDHEGHMSRTTLRLPDKTIRFPSQCVAALREIATGRPVTAETLPGLTTDDAMVVLRRLLREGVVVPSRP
ncbi:cupin domain-containing protein [Rhodococcus sp. HNM0569]|uniref:JmjC domain-containing protein n=1 Tax=Rhodococcus sp. HNM0569 TaxID=2716340 RepID=UPI00146F8F05|nr:cupin [Rhodococcus sp. HNM0569]